MIQYAFLLLIAAYSEELLCRGFIFRILDEGRYKFTALVISSAIFALLHGLNASLNLTAIANLFLSGALFALVYTACSYDLSVPTGLHFMWNFLQGPILGFHVSGLRMNGLLKVTETPSSWSGGSFGLEGSLVLTVILSIVVVALLSIQPRRISITTASSPRVHSK